MTRPRSPSPSVKLLVLVVLAALAWAVGYGVVRLVVWAVTR